MNKNPGMLFPYDFKVEGDTVHFNAIAHNIDAEALFDFFMSHKQLLEP